ncbi:MAG: hypothetical protein OQL08_00270 [Gammaproteobacteria bacterium]|nr:hypothetical protein [Gammaproteobacteria bacterium]
MSERIHATQVGAPDPERRNSPILDESAADEQDGSDQEVLIAATCHFNAVAFEDGALICSGDELLRCERGAWLRLGSCDPENP